MEEVVLSDLDRFLAEQEVDRYRLVFVDLIKMERAAHPDSEVPMSVVLNYFMKLPDVIRAVMRRVVSVEEITGVYVVYCCRFPCCFFCCVIAIVIC